MSNLALVTGASSGIGKSLSYELAKKKYDLIIHGRNLNSLQQIKQEIEKLYSVSVEIIICELSNDSDLDKLISSIQDKDINLLVNNAGFGVAGTFDMTDLDAELDMVKVIVNAPMKITKSLLPKLKSNTPAYILNVSSLYSHFSVPKQAIYGASKAFQHSFSLALNEELRGSNVHVSSLCPGLTYSNFRLRQGKEEKKHIVGMTSDAVAKIALRGLFNKRPTIIPGFFNKMMAIVLPNLRDRLALRLIFKMNSSRGL